MNTHDLSKTPYFDHESTAVIKGVALIMMFFHHFFTIPEYWTGSVFYPTLSALSPYLRIPFKMCVPVFCFLTGYFYFFNRRKTYGYSLQKITDIALSYWPVFFVFAALSALFAGVRYTPGAFLAESFALYRPTMIFCWYVYFYCLLMLLFPLLARVLGQSPLRDLSIAFVLTPFTFTLLQFASPADFLKEIFSSMSWWTPCALSGYLFARYDGFQKCEALWKRFLKSAPLSFLAAVLLAAASLMMRLWVSDLSLSLPSLPLLHIAPMVRVNLDILYAPLFIFALLLMQKSIPFKGVHRVIGGIGKKSLLMWFTSCLFFGNAKAFFQPFLYLPRNAFLVMVWGTALCYLMALFFDFLTYPLLRLKNRFLLNHFQK